MIPTIGARYGRLTIQADASRAADGKRRFLCRCDCGGMKVIRARAIQIGHARSCGCLRREIAATKNLSHGQSRTVEHWTWTRAKARCYDTAGKDFPRYGGRGIYMSAEWRDDFARFLLDMGPRPSVRHSLDRIDNNGPYSVDNCRWATQTMQQGNRRSNRRIEHDGRSLILKDWARHTGLPAAVIAWRLKVGWSVRNALTLPITPHSRRHHMQSYRH